MSTYRSLTYYIDLFFDDMRKSGKKMNANDLECFYRCSMNFTSTGEKADAFSVYFSFSEIYHIFGTGYDNTRKLLEILSDYEYHAGALLNKHRDHYSHSVYVFMLGLAFYAGSDRIRKAFSEFYGKDGDIDGFLHLWGYTALFHDIGYPFEIAHDEIRTFTENLWPEHEDVPFVAYGNLDSFISLSDEESSLFADALGTGEMFPSLNSVFSYWLNIRLGYDRKMVETELEKEQASRKFQDHAYFSAVLLTREILDDNISSITPSLMDAVIAILLHNSLNRFNTGRFSHDVALFEHPLTYILMLADNLQDWNREAYGVKTKAHPLAWKAEFDISDDAVKVLYVFDSFIIRTPDGSAGIVENSKAREVVSGAFRDEVLGMLGEGLALEMEAVEIPKDAHTERYASTSSFVNLCDFAKSIHANYIEKCNQMDTDFLDRAFGDLTLEEKLSNIEQAKSYSRKLELVNCFYSDKDLDYPVVYEFTESEVEFLAREEHVRWVREKLSLGWKYGRDYIDPVTGKADRDLRNRLKQHADILPYDSLDDNTQEKDRMMIRNMIPFLWKHGKGIRIYRYRMGMKPTLDIVAVGHRKIAGNTDMIREKVKDILRLYMKDYNVVLRSSFSPGADQLVMECAVELGLTIKASLPLLVERKGNESIDDWALSQRNLRAFIDYMYEDARESGYTFGKSDEEKFIRLISQTAVCHIFPDANHTWVASAKHMINESSRMIALWDGVKTKLKDEDGNAINRGGTWHSIDMARTAFNNNESFLHIIPVER